MKTRITFAAMLLLFSGIASAQVNILAARQAPLNTTVTVRGIVTNGSELGSIRYIQDSTAGIALYGNNLNSVNRGDSIVATGTLTDYNNLLEIQPVSTFSVFTPVNPLPAPQLITPAQMGEAYEGQLVQIDLAVFANGGIPFAGNTSYTFTSNSQTGTVYVRTGSPLVGIIIPTGPTSIRGIMSQFYTTYQLLPRDSFDIIPNSSIVITTPVTETNMTTSGFDLNWTTNITGSTYIKYGYTPALELGTINGTAGINHTVSVTGASPASIFYAQAYSVNGTDTAYSPVRAYATVSASTGWIKTYFNKSVDTNYSTGTNATMLFYTIDDTLIAYINRAQYSVDVTIYHFDNQNISNISTALNNAYNRGVKVRVITDGSYISSGVAQLDPNIHYIFSPVGGSYGIMHNKFVVIDAESPNPDEAIVWTGGTNFSDGQINIDPNDVIIFQDQSMAKGYTIEFEEMWGDTGVVPDTNASKFGPYKSNNTPHEYLVGGVRVEQYFSPTDGVNAKIIEKIGTAGTDLCVATMLITRTDIAYALVNASNSGVNTSVLVDDPGTTTTWSILLNGLPPNHLADFSNGGIMHHKYMIVDPSDAASDPMVLTGCHNWSSSADSKNDENTVIVHDATIANLYYQAFVPRFTQNGGIIGIATAAQNNPALQVYPNPAGDVANVLFTLTETATVSFAFTDLSGRLVSTQQTAGIAGENRIALPTADLPAGVYFLHMNGKVFSATAKIVISR